MLKQIRNGIIDENPIFMQVLGMCPTLAVTTAAMNGLGMGLATTAVLMGSNLVIALLRNFIPNKIRIPAFIVIIASFVTAIDLLLQGYIPSLHKQLGLFIPLIVVNCLILSRAEAYASKNKVLPSIMDGLGMGLGFTIALTLVGIIREFLGTGAIFNMQIVSTNVEMPLIFILPPGAFLVLGILLAIFNAVRNSRKKG